MTKSWRDKIPVHPAADLFPLMSEPELRELGEDIKKNGLRIPIIVQQDGDEYKVVDGRNRLDAMKLVGIEFEAERLRMLRLDPLDDPYDFVLSANIHRRHLTAEQKRNLIAKLLKAKPEKSNNAVAKQVKVDGKTVAKVRREMEGRSEIPNVETRMDTKGRKQPAKKTHHGKVKAESNEHQDSKDEDPGVASPEEIKSNILDTIDRHKAVVRAYKKVLAASHLDQDAKDEVSGAIGTLITTWQSLQRALARHASSRTPSQTPPKDDFPDLPASLRRVPVGAS